MNNPEIEVITGKVISVLPGYRLAHLKTEDGRMYALTKHNLDINLDDVKEGQVYRCTVSTILPRVLKAKLIG